MYVPEHFREQDRARLAALIRDYAFGMLVTIDDGVPFANHLPFIYDPDRGGQGTLTAHMARANPQWRHLAADPRALAVFQGPHTYVSPTWYASAGVPTWNYAVAHVYGRATIIEDRERLGAIVTRLSAIYEAGAAQPWQPDLTEARTSRMLDFIVGFEIEISSIEGKFKMSQNRSAEDRQRVIGRLGESPREIDRAVAEVMAANERPLA